MFGISYIRIAAALALVVAIAGAAWKLHHTGYTAGYDKRDVEAKAELAVRTSAALVASEKARATEQVLQTKVARIDHDFQAQKTLRVAADKRSTDSLQRLEAVLATASAANSNTSATSGIDGADPRNTIIGECSRQLVTLDAAYGRLVDKATALQQYAIGVHVTP